MRAKGLTLTIVALLVILSLSKADNTRQLLDTADEAHSFLSHCVKYAQFLAPIHSVANIWKYSGGLQKDRFLREVEQCGKGLKECAWVKIYNNRVYLVRHLDSAEPRIRHALVLLYKAVAALAGSGQHAPNIEFGLLAGDNNRPSSPPGPIWWSWGSLPESENSTFRFPDPAYLDWNFIMGTGNSWSTKRPELHEFGQHLPFEERIPKFVFRGVNSSEARISLLEQFTSRKDIGDVRPFTWTGGYPIPDWAHDRDAGYLSIEDNCRYKYILYAEGWGFSFRLKYLFMCGSIVISHDTKYKDILLAALTPGEDIYFVGPKWERLEEVYRMLEGQDQSQLAAKARAVTDKVYDFTSDHGLSCYITELLWQYKDNVQTWDVEKPSANEVDLDHVFKLAAQGRDHERCYDAAVPCNHV